MSNKLEQDRWERENEDEIIDRFLEFFEEEINASIKNWLNFNSPLQYKNGEFIQVLLSFYNTSKEIQYESYLDTEESDHMKEGGRDNVGDR